MTPLIRIKKIGLPLLFVATTLVAHSKDLTARINMYLTNDKVTDFSFFQTKFNKTSKPELWLKTNRNVNGRMDFWDVFVWTDGKYERLDDYASLREITLNKFDKMKTDLIITYWHGSAYDGLLLGYRINGNKLEEFDLGEIYPRDKDEYLYEALFSNKIKPDNVPRNQLKNYIEERLALSAAGLNSSSTEKWAPTSEDFYEEQTPPFPYNALALKFEYYNKETPPHFYIRKVHLRIMILARLGLFPPRK